MRALALLSGVLMGAAFLAAPLGVLAWIAFVPLYAALDRAVRVELGPRGLFLLGWMWGLGAYLVGFYWMLLLSPVAISEPLLKYPAWLVGGAYLAVYPGLTVLAAGMLVRKSGRPLALVLPFAWVLGESLRGFGEIGFPWFQPGYTQHAFTPLIQMASLGSVSLVTLWLVALNGLIWSALQGGERMRAAMGVALLFALPFFWGQRALDAAPKGETAQTIALVQANIAGEIKWSGEHQEEILDTFLVMTRRLAHAAPATQLVIWPETATGSYLSKQPDQADSVFALARELGVPILSGYADYDFAEDGTRRFRNAAAQFLPNGTLSPVYAKRHLVPFGERMPFQAVFPFLGKMQLGQAEWTPGERPGIYPFQGSQRPHEARTDVLVSPRPLPQRPFGVLICFESIFPRLAREDVRAGARWLVNITNDEWFGNSAALYQHAAMARFRAVENRVPLARCANTGLTAMIDAYGRFTGEIPVFTGEVLTADLPPAGPASWFTRIGDWPAGLSILVVVVLAATPRRRVRDR